MAQTGTKKKVKTILISQPTPSDISNPYTNLESTHKVKIDFRSFVKVEGVTAKEFRFSKVDLSKYSAIIFTSRNSVDHYFRIMELMKLKPFPQTKYFCVSEATAYYLQKYIVFRRRCIFFANNNTLENLKINFNNYKDTEFLLPCADLLSPKIIDSLDKMDVKYRKTIMYKTVCSDLSDLNDVCYDILVFFSPTGIKSLFQNFPDFTQRDVKIAVFGSTTAKAAQKAGLEINILAPQPEYPSMSKALEVYIKKVNKR